jgi:tetratricopeptide (TPR) repeat protein
MRKLVNIFYGVCVLLLLEMPYGCQRMNSFETAAGLDQEGKSAQAILAYQDYLQNFPKTPLGSKICYRIAKNYEASSDFENALKWYEKILNEYPNTDENLHALLDMAALNQNKLKNNGKAVEYYQSALSRYREGDKIRDAVQFLVEAQYQSANVFFLLRDYKHAAQVAEAVYQSYPMEFLPPETRAKVDSLDDRAKRADQIALATSDAISIRQEKPFDKSYENDFPTAPNMEGKSIPSPDGKYLR